MQSQLYRYKMLAKRWMWMVVLGIVLCGGASYAFSKSTPPVYQASTLLILEVSTSTSTAYDSTSASLAALPTYAQLLTSPTILKSVVAQHKGLTIDELTAMLSVKPQASTQIIELDVQSKDPQLAMQLANEISQSIAAYASANLPGRLQIVPAELPTIPVSPKTLSNTVIGVLIGFVLALALIVIFEWIDDRLTRPEEAQEVLGLDTWTILPQLSRNQHSMQAEKIPAFAEAIRTLCAQLNAAQAIRPFKLVMVTSALAGEGKSTVALNLAYFLAMGGKSVLLVDANLREPVLDKQFQLDNHQGLTHAFLEKEVRLEEELDGRLTDIPTLRVLTTGVLPSNPTEMLQSPLTHQLCDLLKKSSRFDYVIFDTPPLLPVADAQILAAYVQTTLLVIDASKTPRKILARAKLLLNRTRTPILGIVLNKSPWPDYGDIRQYLHSLQRNKQLPKVKFDALMPLHASTVDGVHAAIPTTPAVNGNGVVNADTSVAISRQDKNADEK